MKSRVLTRPGFVYVRGVCVLLWCFVVFCRVLSGAIEVLGDRGRERKRGLGAVLGEDLCAGICTCGWGICVWSV